MNDRQKIREELVFTEDMVCKQTIRSYIKQILLLGIGWRVIRDESSKYAYCSEPPLPFLISHSGAAVGASSALVIEPNHELIVSIITNLNDVGVTPIATEIARIIVEHLESNQIQ